MQILLWLLSLFLILTVFFMALYAIQGLWGYMHYYFSIIVFLLLCIASVNALADDGVMKRCDSSLNDGSGAYNELKQSTDIIDYPGSFIISFNKQVIRSPQLRRLDDGAWAGEFNGVVFYKDHYGYVIKADNTPFLVFNNCSVRF